jgi:hypothetical protein
MNIYLKVGSYAALLGIWGVFAFFGRTPVDGFIAAITAALAALGAIHAVSTASAPPPAAPPPKDAP